MKNLDQYLNDIIDDVHPLFTPITDEEMAEETEVYARFEKEYLHKDGKKFRMKWKVYFGTPETVKTVFEPAEVIE